MKKLEIVNKKLMNPISQRCLDELGRIVIPKELRTMFNLEKGKELFVERVGQYIFINSEEQDNTYRVKNMDELGCIVIPIELRKELELKKKEPIEIYTYDKFVILKKKEIRCIFCDSQKGLNDFKDRRICKKCLKEMYKTMYSN